jgi:hypothetical protein
MLLLIRLLGAALAVAVAPLVLTPMVDRRRHAALRRLVPEVCSVLDAHGIDYWADFGTLLGFRREADIIKSDKDADLSVMAEEKARIVALAPAFARAGMELNPGAGRSGRVLRILDPRTRYHLDIYVYIRDGHCVASCIHPVKTFRSTSSRAGCRRHFLAGRSAYPKRSTLCCAIATATVI